MCGHRNAADQTAAWRAKTSKVQWPLSKHNREPSVAVDVIPYPVDWQDLKRFYFFGGYVKKTAELLGVKIIWGGDWDSDTEVDDQNFNDLPHFELVQGE